MRTESRDLLAVGIFGSSSRLGDRIEMLLRHGRTFSPRALSIGIAASAVILSGFMLAGSLTPRWIAFAQQQPHLIFEVASIKPGKSASNNGEIHFTVGAAGGRLTAVNLPLRFLYHVGIPHQGISARGRIWLGRFGEI
jgi:hypothetical protein